MILLPTFIRGELLITLQVVIKDIYTFGVTKKGVLKCRYLAQALASRPITFVASSSFTECFAARHLTVQQRQCLSFSPML